MCVIPVCSSFYTRRQYASIVLIYLQAVALSRNMIVIDLLRRRLASRLFILHYIIMVLYLIVFSLLFLSILCFIRAHQALENHHCSFGFRTTHSRATISPQLALISKFAQSLSMDNASNCKFGTQVSEKLRSIYQRESSFFTNALICLLWTISSWPRAIQDNNEHVSYIPSSSIR